MKVYKKVGRRYQEMGMEFTGFPCNGAWWVKDGSQSCMLRLHDIGNTSVHALPCLELVEQFFKEERPMRDPISSIDLVRNFAKYCAKHADVATLK